VVNGVTGSETRYSIGSGAGTAQEYLHWIRGHWGIEIPQPEDLRSNNLCAV
jgi:hypothetical protein